MNTKIFTSQTLYEAAKVYVDWVPGDAYVAPHFTFVNDDDDALGEEYHLLSSGVNGKVEYINGYKKVVTAQGTHKYEDTIFCELENDAQALDAEYLATLGISAVVANGKYQYTAVVSHQNVPVHTDATGKYYLANGVKIYLTPTDVTEILVNGGEVIDVNIIAVLDFHKSMAATPGYYVDPITGVKYKPTMDTWTDKKGLFCIPSDDDILLTFLKFVDAKEKINAYYSYEGDNHTTAILLPEEEAKLEKDEEGNVILFTTITHENALVEVDEHGHKYVSVNGNHVGVSETSTVNDVEVSKVSFEVWLTFHPEVPAVKAHYEDQEGNHYHVEDITVKPYTSKDEWKFILVKGEPCNNDDLDEVGSDEVGSEE